MAYLGRSYHLKFFKGCLPQILLGPFLNTLTQIIIHVTAIFRIRNENLQYSEHCQRSMMELFC